MTSFDRAAHCQRIAASGGAATRAKYDRWHYVEIGTAGWQQCVKNHDQSYCRGILKAKHWHGPRRPSLADDLRG